jgi:hypothetical protein
MDPDRRPTGARCKKGQVRPSSVTYDAADQPYAAIAAQQDAQDRAAAEAARRIQLDLAAWLAKPKALRAMILSQAARRRALPRPARRGDPRRRDLWPRPGVVRDRADQLAKR